MARYVIDAATLLHQFDRDVKLDPAHQLVAPNSIRSEALQLLLEVVRQLDWESIREAEYVAVTRLQADALVTVDPAFAARAEAVVPIAPLDALLVK